VCKMVSNDSFSLALSLGRFRDPVAGLRCVKWCPMTSLSLSFSLVSLSLFLSRSLSWSVQGPRGGGAVVDCRPAAARALAPRPAQGSYPRRRTLSLYLSIYLSIYLSLSTSLPLPPPLPPSLSLAHSHTSDRTISRQREELRSCVRRPIHALTGSPVVSLRWAPGSGCTSVWYRITSIEDTRKRKDTGWGRAWISLSLSMHVCVKPCRGYNERTLSLSLSISLSIYLSIYLSLSL
jgi:hypothetical protein